MNLNVLILFIKLNKKNTNMYIKPLYLSKNILLLKKNLFFFNIFNSNFDKKKKFISLDYLKIDIDYYNTLDELRYEIVIKPLNRKNYNFKKKQFYKKKKNKFIRNFRLVFKNYSINGYNRCIKNIKGFSIKNQLKDINKYFLTRGQKFFKNRYLTKINFFLNISSYKLFFNILLFYPFLFLNYSAWFVFKNFYKTTHHMPVNLKNINENIPYYDLSFFTNFGLFLELQTSKNINVIIKKNNFNDISVFFNIILDLWSYRIRRFFGVFKNSFDLYYIVKMFFLVVKNKDIHLLMKLITKITPRIEFNKHRRFFKFIIYMFRCYYSLIYGLYKLQGFQFEFRGKISVDGNARTRKMYAKILRPSPSNYSYSTKYVYKTVKTHTGILGIKVWIYYKQ